MGFNEAFENRLATRVRNLKILTADVSNIYSFQQLTITEANLASIKKRIDLLRLIANFDPLATPGDHEKASARKAAAIITAELSTKQDSWQLSDEDTHKAVLHAREAYPDARRDFEVAQFCIDEYLARWPPDEAHALHALHAHAIVRADTLLRLHALTVVARSYLVKVTLQGAALFGGVSLEAEARARAHAETQFLALVWKRLTRLEQASRREWRLGLVAKLSGAPTAGPVRQLVHFTLEELYGMTNAVRDFEAFPGAAALPYVRALLADTLVAWNGMHVSAHACEVHGIPGGKLDDCTAFLAADGTLCISVWCNSGAGAEVRFHSLITDESTLIRIPGVRWVCVCDGEVFFGIGGVARVFFAPLAAALEGLPVSAFDSFEVPMPLFSAATDRAADGWVVCLGGCPARSLVRVDLRLRTARIIASDLVLNSIGGCSSIRVPAITCVIQSRADKAVFSMDEHGNLERIAHGLSHSPTLLPSAGAPTDLSCAAVIDWNALFAYCGRVEPLPHAVLPSDRSLVRIYQDVFLCLDVRTWRWYALRIVVP